MFRKLFSATALVSVVVAGLSFYARVQACPVDMPETLLSLYKSSKEIHLATFARSIDVAIQSEEDGYSRVAVKKYFDISSTLKGEPRKTFEVDQIEYRYQKPVEVERVEAQAAAEKVPEESTLEEESQEEPEREMSAGNTVILFLAAQEDEEGGEGEEEKEKNDGVAELRLVNQRDGVRWIDAEDVGVYESRIKELNSIFDGNEKGRDSQLAEWVIRAVEQPATRWDGARELDLSFDSLDRLEAAAEYDKTHKEKVVRSGDEDDEDQRPWVDDSDEESAGIAKVLTQAQKDQISNILMTPSNETPTAVIRDGDSMLLAVSQRWGGPDLAEFLLRRIGTGRMDPGEVTSVMWSITSILKDEGLTKAAEAYRDIAWDDENADFEEAEEASTVSEAKQPETPVASENQEQPKRKVSEVRAERLGNFVSMAYSILTRQTAVEDEVAVKAAAARK